MVFAGTIRFEDRFCASGKGGTGGGGRPLGECTALGDSAWQLLQLLQLAIEKAWSALDGPFFIFFVQTIVENGPFTL